MEDASDTDHITLKLTVPEADPKFYGILPEGVESKIPKGTAYSRLKRKRLPPLSKKYKDLSTHEELVKPVLKAFFNGDLLVELKILGTDKIQLRCYVPCVYEPMFTCTISEGLRLRDEIDPINSYGTFLNPVGQTLKKSEKEDIGIVIIQRMLRSMNPMVEDKFFYWTITLKHLSTESCHKKGLYKDAADMSLSWGDVLLNRGDEDDVEDVTIVASVAERLRAAKRHAEAGEIYSEIAKGEVFREHKELTNAEAHHLASQAFYCAFDYFKAEEAAVEALKLCGKKWKHSASDNEKCKLSTENYGNFNPSYALVELIALCHSMFNLNGSESCRIDAYNKMWHSGWVLRGLMLTWDIDVGMPSDKKLRRHLKSSLKKKYHRPKIAFQTALNAFAATTHDEYHAILSQCLVPNHSLHHLKLDSSSDFSQTFKDYRNYAKNVQRKSLEHAKGPSFTSCDNCQKLGEGYKVCPCQIVVYCSIDCQKNHWSTHKKFCSYRA